jgi:hypothetical protein
MLFKAFGFQSVVVRAVMQYVCHHFDAVHVLKPITSRPASAERYVVAEGYRGCGSDRDDDNGAFHGPRWISRMLLASPADVAPHVAAFLDAKDVAMLTLNLKACGDILRRLHQMETQQASDREVMEEEDDEDDESSLPIFSFKTKWQLF